MAQLLNYTNLITCILVFFVWISCLGIILVFWIGSKIENNRFFKAALRSLDFEDDNEARDAIRNDFEVYRNRRYGFKGASIIDLCQELGRKLKLQDNSINKNDHYICKLERIITILKDEYKFDDEKMNEIISNVQNISGKEDARELREYLIGLNAYNNGILFEKERNFKDMQDKLNKKKWVSRFGYIIGIVGSLASIYDLFFSR